MLFYSVFIFVLYLLFNRIVDSAKKGNSKSVWITEKIETEKSKARKDKCRRIEQIYDSNDHMFIMMKKFTAFCCYCYVSCVNHTHISFFVLLYFKGQNAISMISNTKDFMKLFWHFDRPQWNVTIQQLFFQFTSPLWRTYI